ncbi:hypothetical protein NDU88_000732 [Pleurodeles waltl]|uniref:Uncharacterized protein n=1 Tax=Pleurodeles waltl TaxID=8319 RepID=A0AAV7TFV9_PLEWA|nr:hypothetical protein NDU88_000732 [Pleurodeles waltl]
MRVSTAPCASPVLSVSRRRCVHLCAFDNSPGPDKGMYSSENRTARRDSMLRQRCVLRSLDRSHELSVQKQLGALF